LKSLGISEADLCSLDIIVVQRRWTRYRNGPEDVRRIIEIDAVRKDKPGIVKLFEYDQKKDCLKRKDIYGTEPFKKICFNFSFGKKKFEQELKERMKLLESRPASFEDFFQSSNKVMGK
jgi:hypothetical protein